MFFLHILLAFLEQERREWLLNYCDSPICFPEQKDNEHDFDRTLVCFPFRTFLSWYSTSLSLSISSRSLRLCIKTNFLCTNSAINDCCSPQLQLTETVNSKKFSLYTLSFPYTRHILTYTKHTNSVSTDLHNHDSMIALIIRTLEIL